MLARTMVLLAAVATVLPVGLCCQSFGSDGRSQASQPPPHACCLPATATKPVPARRDGKPDGCSLHPDAPGKVPEPTCCCAAARALTLPDKSKFSASDDIPLGICLGPIPELFTRFRLVGQRSPGECSASQRLHLLYSVWRC
jgi:hypothetical protein